MIDLTLEQVIDGHLKAYNNHDIAEFGKYFASEVVIKR
jgi:hypothetical protein